MAEGSGAALPSVEEMRARLAELVEQHGEGSEPVVAYRAQLDAHPDNQGEAEQAGTAETDADPSNPNMGSFSATAVGTLQNGDLAPEDPPADAAKE